jgi:hypothetical protein
VDPTKQGFTPFPVAESYNWDATNPQNMNNYAFSFWTHIDFSPAQIEPGTPVTGGKVYLASWSPFTATTRLILRSPNVWTPDPSNPLATPGPVTYTPVFDAQVQLDLGQLTAAACYGVGTIGGSQGSICG